MEVLERVARERVRDRFDPRQPRAHHVGPHGESFAFDAFVYRALAGVFFGIVYHLRGFAVAVWSHALYDVYVFTSAAP